MKGLHYWHLYSKAFNLTFNGPVLQRETKILWTSTITKISVSIMQYLYNKFSLCHSNSLKQFFENLKLIMLSAQ